MDDAATRLAQLSPEKRRLLERMAERVRPHGAPGSGRTSSPAAHGPLVPVIDEKRFAFDTDIALKEKSDIRAFYDAISGQLNASEFAEHSVFLNYGYVPNDAQGFSSVSLAERVLSKNAVRLVLELVGGYRLHRDQRLLDVGCGRGGTLSVLRRYFDVGPAVGLDLSAVAIGFCHSSHAHPGTSFLVGDAEHLPFAHASFDVVSNVESSHAYPDADAFFVEVARVLRPAGVFLYTDIVPAAIEEKREAFLAEQGLAVVHRRDITSNVLLSCDETAASHTRAFRSDNSRAIIERFLGVRGTPLYEGMKDGSQKYLLYRFQKGASTP